MNEKLYAVHGSGSDTVGLVERITAGVAAAGGNIIDLRQDVLHGLFAVHLVADFGQTDMRLEQFRDVMAAIGEDTGLDLRVARYLPTSRDPATRSLLMVLVGRDRPGIIAGVSHDLSVHRINIELARMIAREDVFLMELLTDITRCTLPLDNLESVVRAHMAGVGIHSMFQRHEPYNPKKRVILFSLGGSLVAARAVSEVCAQAGLAADDLPVGPPEQAIRCAAGALDGVPSEVFARLARAAQPTPGTVELVQSLKFMGYRVALATRAFSPVVDALKESLGLDHAWGIPLSVDDDAQTVVGDLGACPLSAQETDRVVARLMAAEGVTRDDISVVADTPQDLNAPPPGIRLDFDMRLALDFLNQRVLSRETLVGGLGSFGLLRASRGEA